MASDVDIVIESRGSNPFLPLSEAGIESSNYERVIRNRNLKRKLRSIGCGANPLGDLAPDLKALLAEIDKETGGDVTRLGAICLYGDSNGSGLMLAVAKALKDRGAPKPIYIGLGDLTMMPFGRNPPVPGIGTLQPINPPGISFGLDVALGINLPGVLIAKGLPPSVSDGPPPRIIDPGVDADTRENYFTVQGNRARVFSQSPAGASNWWWTSTMNFGEVHGEIPGWTNIRKVTDSNGSILTRGPGSVDEGHHIDLCGKALRAMQFEAGQALGRFAAKLP